MCVSSVVDLLATVNTRFKEAWKHHRQGFVSSATTYRFQRVGNPGCIGDTFRHPGGTIVVTCLMCSRGLVNGFKIGFTSNTFNGKHQYSKHRGPNRPTTGVPGVPWIL